MAELTTMNNAMTAPQSMVMVVHTAVFEKCILRLLMLKANMSSVPNRPTLVPQVRQNTLTTHTVSANQLGDGLT